LTGKSGLRTGPGQQVKREASATQKKRDRLVREISEKELTKVIERRHQHRSRYTHTHTTKRLNTHSLMHTHRHTDTHTHGGRSRRGG
jgi:hypothetical protein